MADDPPQVLVTSDGGSKIVMILVAVIVAIAVFTAVWFSNQSGAPSGGEDVVPAINLETGQVDPGTATTISP